MAKTGWKSGISNTSSAGKTNRTPKGNASSKLTQGRRRDKQPGSERSAETIQRLKMYSNGKAIRNKAGKIVAGTFMMQDRAGDRKIEASTGRIQPDRRWFGNTRVVGATELDRFRQEMTEKVADPYSVVLKRKKLPMGLLQDAAEYKAGNQKAALLEQEPFDQAFGKNSRRKRVKLDQLFVQRAAESADSKEDIKTGEGEAIRSEGEGIDWRHEKKDDLFLKGQSKRIWGEFFKVVDCSDVVLHIIDARNVPGTRCTMIERHIAKNASHKHLVFVLNKIDLVPNWVAKRWMGELAAVRPTIAFHASLTNAFGKGALISLLRQFGKLHEDKKQISVGVIGYPNVGKSSVINTLISKKSCKVAPIPGETKIWQYVTLFKRISLIDCPGVVVDTAGDTEEDSVLKGVVRAERLENPEDFIDAIMGKVKREHIAAQYKLPKDGEETWSSSGELMEMIARRSGRLLKGGDPCIRTAALMIINDFQRGRLPHFIPPPELKVEEDQKTVATEQAIQIEEQNLDDVVVVEKEMEQDEEGVETKTNDHAAIADTETVIDTSSILIGDGKWDE
ncbi:predicted protein [Phaeodactylum tricornutum CCAP 1055/1]|uniref:Nucleolar GTP-binding protein 2 n=1 Tax=Phaeodactylum tricornutum (strain CCAP 1055/1) TaxID=556484 RepID=B7FRR0_PHATC|nr:predicted protein [Phaeodactylum tricornutum CCAP 1055/1]EEC50659.1 predicted protein [Phaeodactylum tricornutum CCAP 1055/1]|eukprot:XP_002177845.1 predicted protein [Phaeodactylum tricornutum CCAP 1055/1]